MNWEEVKRILDELKHPISAAVSLREEMITLLRMPQTEFEIYVDHFLKPTEPERYGLVSRMHPGSSDRNERDGRVR